MAENERDFAEAEANLRKSQQLLEQNQNTRGLLYHAVLTDLGGVLFRTESLSRSAGAERDHCRGARSQRSRRHARSRHRRHESRVATDASRRSQRCEAAAAEAIRRSATLAQQRSPHTPASYRVQHHAESIGSPGRARKLLTAAREQARVLGAEFWVARRRVSPRSLAHARGRSTRRDRCSTKCAQRGAPMPRAIAIDSPISIERKRRSSCCREPRAGALVDRQVARRVRLSPS